MKKADIKFILYHRETKTEIEMSVLGICDEYSHLEFAPDPEKHGKKYDGIDKLPYLIRNGSADEYDVYVVFNGEKYEYSGKLYFGNGKIGYKQTTDFNK
jgi:hypothetical protein